MKQTGRRRHATHLRMTAGLGLAGLVLSGCSQPVDLRKHTFTIELGQDVYANPALYADEGQQGLEHMTVSLSATASPGKTIGLCPGAMSI